MVLPQEISDLIIDVLDDDFDTLRVCSLACRSWVARSQHHIHRHVFIDGTAERTHQDMDRYSSPHVARLVQSLKIQFPPETGYSTDTFPDDPCWVMASKFPEVRTLSICGLDCNFDETQRELLSIRFTKVTSLTLELAAFKDTMGFAGFIGIFPLLQTLALLRAWFYGRAPKEELALPAESPIPMVRQLTVYSMGGRLDLSSLRLWISHLSSISRHGIELVTGHLSVDSLAVLLPAVGKSLTRLRIEDPSKSVQLSGPSLAHNTELQHLTIDLIQHPSVYSRTMGNKWCPSFLLTITSKRLTHLEFRWQIRDEHELEDLDFGEVDSLLDGGPLSFVSSFTWSFTPSDRLDFGRITEILHAALPCASTRGVLQVKFGHGPKVRKDLEAWIMELPI